jgi:hypothetical protein
VDLVNHTVVSTCNVSFDVAALAVDATPTAYAVPRIDQWVPVHQVDLAACQDRTRPSSHVVRASSPIVLHPSAPAAFVAEADNSVSLTRCVLGPDAGIACSEYSPINGYGQYGYCGRLWLSPDGKRLYTGCGVVLSLPLDVTVSPPQFAGRLGSANQRIAFASWAAGAKKVVVQPAAYVPYGTAEPYADTVVRMYDDTVLTPLAKVQLPRMPAGPGTTVFSRGKFAFTTPTADKVFVIVQADAPSLAYALVTLTP